MKSLEWNHFFFFVQNINSTLTQSKYIYACETSFLRLKSRPLPPSLTNTYTCRMIIVPRVCGGE